LTELLSHSASRRRLFMNDRPKSNVELANEILRKSNPPEMMEKRGENGGPLGGWLRNIQPKPKK
jgi:hypothetical protein